MTRETILFVDDEDHLRQAAEQTLHLEDLDVACFSDATAALAHVARDYPGIMVTDIRMPGMDGLTLMAKALEIDPEFPVILVTGHGDVDLAVQSMRDGAYDFLEKPYDPVRLVETARRALDKRRLTLENRALDDFVRHGDFDGVVADGELVGPVSALLAKREGAILPLLSVDDQNARFWVEKVVTINTTAAGGNASLLATV